MISQCYYNNYSVLFFFLMKMKDFVIQIQRGIEKKKRLKMRCKHIRH